MIEILKNALAQQVKLTDGQWAWVSSRVKTKKTKRNEILLEKGETARYLFFVAKGCLRIFLVDDAGNGSTRFLVFEGRFGTAFPSFALQQPSAAAIQTVEPSEIAMIHYNDYQTI